MSTLESKITEWFASQSCADKVKFPIGIGDDMAQISLGQNSSVLITTDMLLDGVHFDLKSAGIEKVGYKVMAVSLSDCAAMATVPLAAVVSVALPKGFGAEELKELHNGIRRAGDKFGCVLIGGDITSWDKPLAVSSTVLSRPGKTEPIQRSGAKVGDVICVTGSLGGSLAGGHLEFVPRIDEALSIAEAGATAMIDLSDGLSTDLNHICRMSKVGAVVDVEKIPLSDEAKKSNHPLNAALNDGEDFELLFSISKSNYQSLIKRWKMEVGITEIGQINDTEKVQLKTADSKLCDLPACGYDHLKIDK